MSLHTENELTRKVFTGVVVVVTFALLAGFVLLRARTTATPERLSAVYVEPGSDEAERLKSNASAQISTAVAAGDRLLLAAALDGTDATTYAADLGCEAGGNKLKCQSDLETAHTEALDSLKAILAAPAPAQVDVFASARGLVQHLQRHAAPDGATLYMNISGRHDIAPVDLNSPGLADRIDDTVEAALSSGLFPEDTTGVVANIVMPFSGDTEQDAALRKVFTQLFDATGGKLASFGQAWTAETHSAQLPSFDEAGVSGTRIGAQTTISLDSALFDTDSAEIRTESLPALDEVGRRISTLGTVRSIEIVGFADGSGDPTYNLELTTRRATAVRDQLLARLDLSKVGLDASQVTANGAGSAPAAGQDDQRYRRVDIIVTATAGAQEVGG